MQKINFSIIHSTDFIGTASHQILIGCVHRFNIEENEHRVQVTYPEAVYRGDKDARTLGRTVTLFGTREALNSFWEKNKVEIDTVFVTKVLPALVNELDAAAGGNLVDIGKNIRTSRHRMKSEEVIFKKSVKFLKSRGIDNERAIAESMEYVKKKLSAGSAMVKSISYYSKSSDTYLVIGVAIHDSNESGEFTSVIFDSANVDGFGLSSKNILPAITAR